MRDRRLWIAAAVVAVLAIVIIVGLWPREASVSVASPTPTARATSTATAAPSPTAATSASGVPATGINNDDFGFVVTDLGMTPTIQPAATSTIRKESSAARR